MAPPVTTRLPCNVPHAWIGGVQDKMKACVSGCVSEYQQKLPRIQADLEYKLREL
jgi:hypothetical protein